MLPLSRTNPFYRSYGSNKFFLLPVPSLVPWHGIGWVVYLVLFHTASIVIDHFENLSFPKVPFIPLICFTICSTSITPRLTSRLRKSRDRWARTSSESSSRFDHQDDDDNAGAGDGEDSVQAGHLWRGQHDGQHAGICGEQHHRDDDDGDGQASISTRGLLDLSSVSEKIDMSFCRTRKSMWLGLELIWAKVTSCSSGATWTHFQRGSRTIVGSSLWRRGTIRTKSRKQRDKNNRPGGTMGRWGCWRRGWPTGWTRRCTRTSAPASRTSSRSATSPRPRSFLFVLLPLQYPSFLQHASGQIFSYFLLFWFRT